MSNTGSKGEVPTKAEEITLESLENRRSLLVNQLKEIENKENEIGEIQKRIEVKKEDIRAIEQGNWGIEDHKKFQSALKEYEDQEPLVLASEKRLEEIHNSLGVAEKLTVPDLSKFDNLSPKEGGAQGERIHNLKARYFALTEKLLNRHDNLSEAAQKLNEAHIASLMAANAEARKFKEILFRESNYKPTETSESVGKTITNMEQKVAVERTALDGLSKQKKDLSEQHKTLLVQYRADVEQFNADHAQAWSAPAPARATAPAAAPAPAAQAPAPAAQAPAPAAQPPAAQPPAAQAPAPPFTMEPLYSPRDTLDKFAKNLEELLSETPPLPERVSEISKLISKFVAQQPPQSPAPIFIKPKATGEKFVINEDEMKSPYPPFTGMLLVPKLKADGTHYNGSDGQPVFDVVKYKGGQLDGGFVNDPKELTGCKQVADLVVKQMNQAMRSGLEAHSPDGPVPVAVLQQPHLGPQR